ncbi:MAG: ABC transporter permease subunit [Oscillospiraceae bacterium]|nr:ABC transporter permease subunit [Oscillospiraceae bacterium]
MSKLLSANFMRLRKSATFWLCAVSTMIISAVMIYLSSDWANKAAENGLEKPLDVYFFQLAPFIGAIIAVFISLFLGTEYSDGTIRNKLTVGHTRTNIYLSNFLTCLMGGILITAMWFIGGLPGLFFIGKFEMGLSGVISYFFVALGIMAAFTAIFVWISAVSRNKAITVVLVLLIWAAFTLAGSAVNDRLNEQEFHGGMAYIDGEFVWTEDTPNPMYLTGTARIIFELLHKTLPTCQAIAMTDAKLTTPLLNFAASLGLAAVITAIGILMFRKKDLK